MGSKARHANEILDAIREDVGVFASYTNWIEPFVGGANMIDKVPTAMNRYGNDSNKYLIAMFRAVQNGWVPPDEISEEKYKFLMYRQNDIDEALIAFVGIGCSYSGKWFGGYARGNDSKGKPRNYCLESKKTSLLRT